jgi:hypothetical protein
MTDVTVAWFVAQPAYGRLASCRSAPYTRAEPLARQANRISCESMLTATLVPALPVLVSVMLQTAPAAQLAQATATAATRDSQRVLRDAREAQAAFERTRRANLPINSRGPSGRCDVRVGRFCYWWDDGEFEAPEELPKTTAARRTLLDRLERAASALPGDRWIAGQRVRYLVEGERFPEAVETARQCRADTRWCASLEGFALHASRDFASADSAFSVALAAMAPDDRCRWTNIAILLVGDARKRYERLKCADRGPFEARFWALSRPLYLLPANDLRTEHFARLTMAELIRTSRYPHAMNWDDDAEELLVRYGWETAWSRDPPSAAANGLEVHVVGHEPTPAFSFVPAEEALAKPDSADASDWALHDPLARSRYAPRYARSVSDLDHQVAFFRRGDSAVVVAAFDTRRDTAFAHDSIDAAFAFAPTVAPDSATVVADSSAQRRHAFTATAPWIPLVVSVEARDSAARRVARARTVVHPPSSTSRVTISDLLLFDDPTSLPTSLDDAVPRARGSLRVDRATPVGVYWEMYGVSPTGETLAYTLTVTREGTSWYRRAAERLRVVERRAPVRMQWDEPSARPGATRTRALAVDLSTLPEGRYRIELTLEAGGAEAATASRLVEVK